MGKSQWDGLSTSKIHCVHYVRSQQGDYPRQKVLKISLKNCK